MSWSHGTGDGEWNGGSCPNIPFGTNGAPHGGPGVSHVAFPTLPHEDGS